MASVILVTIGSDDGLMPGGAMRLPDAMQT